MSLIGRYCAVRVVLQYIKKESQATQDKLGVTKRLLQELQIHYDTQEFIESLKGVRKYVSKHLSLLIWIPAVIGALILMCYFAFNAQYLPTISKDSVLYYIFATTILGVFIAFAMGIFFLCPISMLFILYFMISQDQKNGQIWLLGLLLYCQHLVCLCLCCFICLIFSLVINFLHLRYAPLFFMLYLSVFVLQS
ncbi:hypothetical protein HCCG_01789 [Helicobacter cinaedi CCUG 18818 = ATCC BAA-847]|uniref:Integral membrane protein n=2 Tax=Helicobacter cinaedi TaxID=213 RepID=A0ABN0BCE8_9HELI|nr:hypothetical protein [Helicobacter cinaedi]EFR47241.1 hypothetical protein HCCG_01789 [Helicobacter cinaedi CCUG 18818 = ATCC BAA-847]